MTKLTISKLKKENAEVLPAREELSLLNLAAPINSAVAVNALNFGGENNAIAFAKQSNWIFQK